MRTFGNLITRHLEKLQAKIELSKDHWEAFPGFPENSPEERLAFVLEQFAAALPEKSNTDRVLERVILWYLRDGGERGEEYLRPEDLPKITETLTFFEKKKNRFPVDKRDINHFATFEGFSSFLAPYREDVFLTTAEKKSRDDALLNGVDAELIWQSAEARIIHIKTERASLAYGKGTPWCTAYTHRKNFFSVYYDFLIYIEEAGGERFQIHFTTAELRDDKDKKVSFADFMARNPDYSNALKTVFKSSLAAARKLDDAFPFSSHVFIARQVPDWQPLIVSIDIATAMERAVKKKDVKVLGFLYNDCELVPAWDHYVGRLTPGFSEHVAERCHPRVVALYLIHTADRMYAAHLPNRFFQRALKSALEDEDAFSLSRLVAATKKHLAWQDLLTRKDYENTLFGIARFGESDDMHALLESISHDHPDYAHTNQDLLKALTIATMSHNRGVVEEILVSGKNDRLRGRTIIASLVAYLEMNAILPYLASFTGDGAAAFARLLDIARGVLAEHDPQLYPLLAMLKKVDDKDYWCDAIGDRALKRVREAP